jgi:hypothetical protein
MKTLHLAVGLACLRRPEEYPSPAAVDFILAALDRFSVSVFPVGSDDPSDAAALQGKVYVALKNYFERLEQPEGVALHIIKRLSFFRAAAASADLVVHDTVRGCPPWTVLAQTLRGTFLPVPAP